MKKHEFHRKIRKIHRFLGVLIGIQFLLWTIGGFYFAWSNMDEIHGDFERNHSSFMPDSMNLVSPSIPLQKIKNTADSLVEIKLIKVLGKPTYQIKYAMNHGGHMMTHFQLADAQNGNLRSGLSKEEAIALASESFKGKPQIKKIEFIENVDGHSEYREQPLPAYAISFEHPSRTTVYVATELGQVTKFRNEKWRIFDFLWMLHTMDFEGRDNINNWLLRAFSIFGLLTISSGFILFVVSSKWYQKRK